MPQSVNALLSKYLEQLCNIYGKHLKNVILYGSYARGDFTADSDVDIMILVDLPDEDIEHYSDDLSQLGYEYNVEHDIWMMPVVKNAQHFAYWSSVYPFYQNVKNEGVMLYEAA